MPTNLGQVAISSTDNSPTKSGQDAAWIEKGTIINVDLKNFTVDVLTDYESKPFTNLQVVAPYFHPYNGEGIFAMPEVGTSCLVCQPSDDETPFVLGFIGSFELEGAQTANLEDKAGEGGLEDEEFTTPSSTTSTGSTEQKSSDASARGGRPFLNPGDIMFRTRDENFIALRRGGVVQVAATPTCQSLYIPVRNFMRHFAENFEVVTPGGEMEWTVQRAETDPGGEAPTLYRLTLRDKAQNDKADVQLKVGHVDDDIRYELVVAPTNITVGDGEVSGTPKLKMTISKDGDQTFTMSGTLSYTIDQDREVTVKGSDTVSVTGDRSLTAQNILQKAKAAHRLTAASSTEVISGAKAIKAQTVAIGASASASAVLGEVLVAWLASHTHPYSSVPDQRAASLSSILSKTVKLSP